MTWKKKWRTETCAIANNVSLILFEDNTLISLAHITWFMSQFVIGQLLTYQLGLFGSTISLPSDSKDNDFVKYFKLLQQKLW